ncbi:MAG: hypothetical protein DCF25_22585 [Leptolyngbya foveolarum]|uniref:Uncharacterized protein n=1 Tax=Leptolyngbya foveolarum TaxID=47253 RepID=A0A2W4TSK4_9CYAN|nr:MAG: hypothetical protein DCF25_22585 [Leptolyngbya foveolarum]
MTKGDRLEKDTSLFCRFTQQSPTKGQSIMAKKIVITVNFASETLTKRQLSKHLQALVRDCLSDCDEGELPDSMRVIADKGRKNSIKSVFTLETIDDK